MRLRIRKRIFPGRDKREITEGTEKDDGSAAESSLFLIGKGLRRGVGERWMPLGGRRWPVPPLINLCTFGSPQPVDCGSGSCPAWRTGWRDGVPAAHAVAGHCTTVHRPLWPHVHNFTSGGCQSRIACAGKAVLTSTLCPRYGAGQKAGKGGMVNCIWGH